MSDPGVALELKYCQACGYLSRALSLVAAIEAAHGLSVQLTPVSGGRYELWSGERLLLKRSWLTVPSEQAMLDALAGFLAARAG